MYRKGAIVESEGDLAKTFANKFESLDAIAAAATDEGPEPEVVDSRPTPPAAKKAAAAKRKAALVKDLGNEE